ncbi:MFS transporter [Erwinia sp. OLTSP20]|uniref:MFS transporter n=1 Tax=unclassified Erwinia TaxID=2622719 RepID=UPI000C198BFD|nr:MULTISPECIES: MFS transporter [unclassified Erwinia]PIJ50718.1 MFS transporter [Erwinia sp. OAMSP11]PIJ75388.1 MFS transporter [Erwinia sp. OLSSP12]PIJ81886.1 MFS transporter [Erwinia sp. OLCASP19]PIJ84541.1 MFS transporter [Erwinia sp. OLMTSP26]PIJ86888.1 MFS transporter [Erwinia sp. OLMDSP33]
MAPVLSGNSERLLQNRGFVAFWLARTSSGFGFQMLSIIVGWQIYAQTHSAFWLGMIGLIQFLPSVTLALWAGHIADQCDRRRVVLLAQICQWIAIVTLAWLSWQQAASVWVILLLVLIISTAKTLELPSLISMLPALVPDAILPRATAANAVAGQTAQIVGPALGGLLYATGADVVYSLTALLYLISLLMIATLHYYQAPPPRVPATLKTLLAGVHFIRQRPDVLGVISLDLFAVLLGGATALLPIFAHDILHAGPFGLGLLRSAPAFGALLVGFWLSRRALQRHVGIIMFLCVAGFGVATLVFALSDWMWLSLLALFALGGFDMVSMVIRGSLVQLDTPDEMRGRVNAVNAIFINTSNQLGEFESGMLAAWLGAVPAAALGGIGTLAVVALWMWWFPGLRQRQQLSNAVPQQKAKTLTDNAGSRVI